MENSYQMISNYDFFQIKNSFLSSFINYFKEKIFLVTHATLKLDSISYFSIFIICLIELQQLMTYPFNSIVK